MNFIICALGVLLASSLVITQSEAQPCPKCTTEKILVCGQDTATNKLRTFVNECHLLAENCYRGGEYEKIDDGKCKDCPKCSEVEDYPVCGISVIGEHKRFKNGCELDRYNCKKPTEYVQLTCPVYIRKPDGICTQWDKEFKTFDDSCQMETYNCLHQTNYEVINRDGPCPKEGSA